MMGYEKISPCPKCGTKNGEYDMPPPIMLATYGQGIVGMVCNCGFEGPKTFDSVEALILWEKLPRKKAAKKRGKKG